MNIRFAFVVGIPLLFFGYVFGQIIPEDKMMRYEDVAASIDSTICPLNGTTVSDDTLSTAFFKAGTYYPELCSRNISLRYGACKTSMAARPCMWSIFRKQDHRKYKIIVNKDRQSDQARLLYGAPFDACLGIMGHELAHISDYSTKSGWQLMWTGIRYLGKNYRRRMEHQTDSIAVIRGFGWQLYRYAHYVLHEAEIDDAYREYKSDMYMKPEEIFEMMKNVNQ